MLIFCLMRKQGQFPPAHPRCRNEVNRESQNVRMIAHSLTCGGPYHVLYNGNILPVAWAVKCIVQILITLTATRFDLEHSLKPFSMDPQYVDQKKEEVAQEVSDLSAAQFGVACAGRPWLRAHASHVK